MPSLVQHAVRQQRIHAQSCIHTEASVRHINKALAYLFGPDNRVSFSDARTDMRKMTDNATLHNRAGNPVIEIIINRNADQWGKRNGIRFIDLSTDKFVNLLHAAQILS